ncbi:integrin alpha-M [Discoglossus pictus]
MVSIFPLASGFFVDTDQPIIFQNPTPSFGHQVAQIPGGVIVSAPRHQETANKSGQVYHCVPGRQDCQPIRIPDSDDGVNMSLGLSLAVQGNPPQLLVCGPTLQRTCGENVYVNGRCYRLDHQFTVQETLPHSLPECSAGVDIVFLIDGSGSVRRTDFTRMLTFVSTIMETFSTTGAQFALMQYSSGFEIHFDFKTFSASRNPKSLTQSIRQQFGGTLTSTAIQKVVRELFIPERGSRVGAQKLLIVITDGETVGDTTPFPVSIGEAERMGILRYAIGVGDSFSNQRAYNELVSIASKQSDVFRVNDFSVLHQIQQSLQQRIFAIEGSQSLNETAVELEMSQDGFSSIITQEGAMIGSVGAYSWSGGASVFRRGEEASVWMNSTKNKYDMQDSYLGYSLHQVSEDIITIGAPRYQHTGSVLLFKRDMKSLQWHHMATAKGTKIGSYFGSALSILMNSNSSDVLLLVGAPTYYSSEAPGGRVYLCPLQDKIMRTRARSTSHFTISCPNSLHGDSSQPLGHFGSAISLLPDLTGDQIPDLAVGAPYEDQNQGAVYIFPGQPRGFRSSYIQRIAGNVVNMNLMSFGRSVTGNVDMNGDGLPDLTVGSEGKVLIMRSLPVLGVTVSMNFNPPEILLKYFDCPEPSDRGTATTIRVCVTPNVRSSGVTGSVPVQLNYTLQMDPRRSQTRALFSSGMRSLDGSLQLTDRSMMCVENSIRLPECVEDSLSPLDVGFNFSIIGKTVLSEDTRRNHSGQISFQKNCGSDGVCDDDLRINSSFMGLSQLVIGLSLEVNVTVTVQNLGEDSYNSRVLISYPPGLSYRRVSLITNGLPNTVLCSAPDSQRLVMCGINNPRLRPNVTVTFRVSLHVSQTAALGKTLSVTSNVTRYLSLL